MYGNVYNKVDVSTWCTIPNLAEILKTVFLDVDNLVLFDKKYLEGIEINEREIDFEEMFSTID